MMTCSLNSCIIFQISIIITSFWTQKIKGYNQEDHERVPANLGDNVILHCAFDFPDKIEVPYVIHWQKKGVKIPIYIWYDGYPPHLGEGYEGRVSLIDPKEASLNLTNVRESDQGWYECKVYFLNRPNEQLKNGTFVLLDVHAPPHFKEKPPEVAYVRVGESLTLHCKAFGTPAPTVVWQKNNMPIEKNPSIHVMPNELRIDNLGESDIGDYTCIAKNRQGSVTATTKVVVAGPAIISAPPKNQTVLEGGRVELTCEAKALPSNVTYRWFHKGIEISQLSWLNTRTIVKRNGTLLINPASPQDTGKFTCDATNGIGEPDTASAYLNVEYPARINYSPLIQYLPFGLTGVIRCFIQASPPFQFVTWSRDRRQFDPSMHHGELLSNGSLLFEHVTHEHQGRYRCTPYNIHGTTGASSVMEVLVREPPIFTLKPEEFYQKAVGNEVTMSCDGIGQPKPTITWRKADGSKLPKERTFIRSGNLTIKSIKKEDHGKYECVLENIIATLVTSTTLLVDSTTPHAPTNVSVNTSAFAATVTWVPNYDGGYKQSFSIRYRFSDEDETGWKTMRVQPPETTSAFTIYNLQPDTEYDFQVFASNSLGRGLGSDIIRARTKSWDSVTGQFPTDAYGSTYIPAQKPENTNPGTTDTLDEPTIPSTTARPLGPKPGKARNITIEKMAQGWVVSWLPPIEKTVPVAYYHVEYREGEGKWQMSELISKDTAYLIKNLQPGIKYTIRVNAYSITGDGEPGIPLEYKISGPGDSMKGPRAITAGVVGSVLFFVAAIILSVCMVKICNKRKRRKMEKAYMMVTCPVMDGVNGNHSHGGSPVPLKQIAQNNIKAHNDLICSLGTPGSLLDMRKAEYQV